MVMLPAPQSVLGKFNHSEIARRRYHNQNLELEHCRINNSPGLKYS